ncbi:MAG: HNH endonuclease signature motif containing protein [Pseudolabrys sp.]
MPRPRQPETIDELLDRVVVCPSGCWIWTGGDSGTDRDKAGAGYGRILRPGTRNAMAAHRYVYEKFVGPIPYGQQLDHLCAAWSLDPWLNRRCVNPAHLEPVSHNENNVRKRRTMARTAEIALPAPDDQPAPLLAPGERVEDWVL